MKPLVLVTGGAGFIGSHTCDLLDKKGFRVRILDNLSRFENKRWPSYLNAKYEKLKGDVRNKSDWIRALKDVSYVIHLSAIMDFHLEFSEYFNVNTVGTANLYEVIVAKNFPIKKVVVASSQFVYGHGLWKCKTHGLVHPKDRVESDFRKKIWDPSCPLCGKIVNYTKNKENHADPPNQYAISKFTQELIALKLGKIHNIPSTAFRYSIVHGSRQSLTNLYSGALRVFVLQMLAGKKILLFEDGETKRDFVSVHDVARVNVMALTNKKTNYEVYNVGGGIGYTISQLADIVSKELGVDYQTEYGSYRIGDMRHAISSIQKIKNIGWKPHDTEKDSVSDFLKWVKSNDIGKINVSKAISDMRRSGVLRTI